MAAREGWTRAPLHKNVPLGHPVALFVKVALTARTNQKREARGAIVKASSSATGNRRHKGSGLWCGEATSENSLEGVRRVGRDSQKA